jgi:hypothetical protein
MNTNITDVSTLDATPTAASASKNNNRPFLIIYLTCSGKIKTVRRSAKNRFDAIRKASIAADYDMLVQCEEEGAQ